MTKLFLYAMTKLDTLESPTIEDVRRLEERFGLSFYEQNKMRESLQNRRKHERKK